MPKHAPKGILLHGGPPSDSSFQLDEGRKDKDITDGASKDQSETCRSATAKVCCVYEPKSCKVCYPVAPRIVFKGPTGMGCQAFGGLQEACALPTKGQYNYL